MPLVCKPPTRAAGLVLRSSQGTESGTGGRSPAVAEQGPLSRSRLTLRVPLQRPQRGHIPSPGVGTSAWRLGSTLPPMMPVHQGREVRVCGCLCVTVFAQQRSPCQQGLRQAGSVSSVTRHRKQWPLAWVQLLGAVAANPGLLCSSTVLSWCPSALLRVARAHRALQGHRLSRRSQERGRGQVAVACLCPLSAGKARLPQSTVAICLSPGLGTVAAPGPRDSSEAAGPGPTLERAGPPRVARAGGGCTDGLCFSHPTTGVRAGVRAAEMSLVPGPPAPPTDSCGVGGSEDRDITAPSRAFPRPSAAARRQARGRRSIAYCELNLLGVFSLQRHPRPEAVSPTPSFFCPCTRAPGQSFSARGAFEADAGAHSEGAGEGRGGAVPNQARLSLLEATGQVLTSGTLGTL